MALKSADKKLRKSPGRPEGVSGLKDSIIRAGRKIFARHGFAGTSLKMIGEEAGVTNALIIYYFGTKQKLHEEIFMQTASEIGAMRIARLRTVQQKGGSVREVVGAFIEPLEEVFANREGRAFLLFQWRVENEEQALSFGLRKKAYDESTHAYADALHSLLPHVAKEICYARLACIIGANSYAISERHRLDKLTELSPSDGTRLILSELRNNAYKMFL